jgi:hypothetical protein
MWGERERGSCFLKTRLNKMMREGEVVRVVGALVIGMTLLGGGLGIAEEALVQPQSRGIFISPDTGVAVGSVWRVFVGVSKYRHTELNLDYADKDATALHQFVQTHFQGKVHQDHFKSEKQITGGIPCYHPFHSDSL